MLGESWIYLQKRMKGRYDEQVVLEDEEVEATRMAGLRRYEMSLVKDQRPVFQGLCAHIARQGIIHRQVPDAKRSNLTPAVSLSILGAGCLFRRVLPRFLYERLRGSV